MAPGLALAYSFLLGLLHGIIPDEHTWPITFSYAVGGGGPGQGFRAGFYFSLAFAVQRALISELAYLALAPFLLLPAINGIVYIVVGVVMSAAGAIILRRNRRLHIHLIGHHHEEGQRMETSGDILARRHIDPERTAMAPPIRWTIIHGFIAGFGLDGFSLFINTVAAPAMPSPWLGFLPGLLFGIGTMIVLVIIGALFGASLHMVHAFSEQQLRRIGSQTGSRTLFFGGLLFAVFGIITLLGLLGGLPVDLGSLLIALFMLGVAVPAFVYSLRDVRGIRKQTEDVSDLSTAEGSGKLSC